MSFFYWCILKGVDWRRVCEVLSGEEKNRLTKQSRISIKWLFRQLILSFDNFLRQISKQKNQRPPKVLFLHKHKTAYYVRCLQAAYKLSCCLLFKIWNHKIFSSSPMSNQDATTTTAAAGIASGESAESTLPAPSPSVEASSCSSLPTPDTEGSRISRIFERALLSQALNSRAGECLVPCDLGFRNSCLNSASFGNNSTRVFMAESTFMLLSYLTRVCARVCLGWRTILNEKTKLLFHLDITRCTLAKLTN